MISQKVAKRWMRKKLQMQGAQNLRSERTWVVRRSDEGEAQRRRWTFYEAINYVRGPIESPEAWTGNHPNAVENGG